jgi:hypothetical protein
MSESSSMVWRRPRKMPLWLASVLASTATRRVRCSARLFRFDHERAMATLSSYEVDLVLVFRPPFLPNFQP